MKKLVLTLLAAFLLLNNIAYAKDVGKTFDKIIHRSHIVKGGVSISFKDVSTGKCVEAINSDMQLSPASTQKLLTFLPAINTLGENYRFSTVLYQSKNGDYYLKLGADPYLTTDKLKVLTAKIKEDKDGELKRIFVDDSILDNQTWGEGWQWDDSLNILMPKFGAYNIDKNLYSIIVKANSLNTPGRIFTEVFYPTSFINETISVKHGNAIRVTRDLSIPETTLIVKGDVSDSTKIQVPVQYIKKYFFLRLDEAIRENKIDFSGKILTGKVPPNSTVIGKIETSISLAANDILKNSNNMVAETVFKLAGGKYVKNTGTIASAIAMFNNYCNQNKLDCSKIRLTDGSGVSKNNLITADFFTDFLVKADKLYGKEKMDEYLSKAGEGTLKYRLIPLGDKLHAKTGTLSNISGIVGYLNTKNGKRYAFAIYETDGTIKPSEMKIFEDFIIKEAYDKL